VTKARLIYVLLFAAIFAYILAFCFPGHGMSDGGGW